MRVRTSTFAVFMVLAVAASAQRAVDNFPQEPTYSVLHAFGSGSDGGGVWDSVVFDKQGNLYGTTSGGGEYDYGTVFELSPVQNGEWTEAILQDFQNGDRNGSEPNGGLVAGGAGDLYGTTQRGGAYYAGVVFELTPGAGGWDYTVAYDFGAPGTLACCPWGNLIAGPGDSLYGTGYVAFELSPAPDGRIEDALHTFTGRNGDGLGPQAGPIMDSAGNLYGTTLNGGGSPVCPANDGCGTVYELEPAAVGAWAPGITAWKERILHRFGYTSEDGVFPGVGQLAIDPQGSLYGTADGGEYRSGIVYRLTLIPAARGGIWAETILYNFTGHADGYEPSGGVTLDSAGNLYGTTINGGAPLCGCGVVYKLSPQPDGQWQYTLLHTFVGSDGAEPDANLTIGPDGNLYGTASAGGAYGGGVVFQIQITP